LLSIAIAGVKELAKDVDIGSNIKSKILEPTETGRIVIPLDAVKVINLYIENGDKILPLAKTDNINPIVLKDTDGNAIRRVQEESRPRPIGYTDYNYFGSRFNRNGEYLGGEFGTPVVQPYKWEQFDGEIQVDVRVNSGCMLMVYQTDGLGVSDITVISPLAEEAIKSFMSHKWMERGQKKGIWEGKNDKSDFYNEARLLNSRVNGLTYAEYMATVRELEVNAPKR
jgi:hypothetical protein